MVPWLIALCWLALFALLLRFSPESWGWQSSWLWRLRSPITDDAMGFCEGCVVGPGEPGDLVYPSLTGVPSRRTLVHLATDGGAGQGTIAISHGAEWTGTPRLFVGQRVAVQGFPIDMLLSEAPYRESARGSVMNAFRLKTFAPQRDKTLFTLLWASVAICGSLALSLGTAVVIV